MTVLERLNGIGYERARRATAALGLSLFVFFYLLLSLNAPPGWGPAFLALATCYGVAFMGVAAEWFWGRWFAAGLGWSGVMVSVASLAMIGWTPVLAIYGGIHGLIAVLLAGRTMADRFDMQAAWRERYGMDEYGVARLRKTVTRASASLPSVILYFLGPKEPGQDMLVTALALAAGALAVGGLAGVVRMRTWGVMALGAASAALLPFATHAVQSAAALEVGGQTFAWAMGAVVLGPGLPAALLAFAVLPFAIPAVRYLRRRG